MAVRVLLIRHGQTNANALQQLQGISDIPGLNDLNDAGRRQAREAAAELMRRGFLPDAILASPLARARETAQIIADTLDLDPPTLDDRLKERNYGELEGAFWHLLPSEVWKKDKSLHWDYRDIGGDAARDLRIKIADLSRFLEQRYNNETVAAVCHGGFIRFWLTAYRHPVPARIVNGGIYPITL